MNQIRTFWISLGIALFAVFLLYSYSQEKTRELTKKYGIKTKVLVATKDILEMQAISDDAVEVVESLGDFIQPGTFKNPEEVIGKVALVPINKGEHILENKVMNPSPITGLSHQIQPGKRAISIPVDQTRSISYMIRPGDRVDVIVSSDENNVRVIKTLLESVSVLATGQNIANELPRLLNDVNGQALIHNIRREANYQTVTLELNPFESQKIIYFLSVSPSSLFLSLRHPTDERKNRRLGEINLKDILKRKPSSSKKKEKAKFKPGGIKGV